MTLAIIPPSVSLVNGRPAVTSLDVAEHFGKRHGSVLRDIRRVMAEMPEDLREHNFVATFRTVAGPNNSQRQEEYFIIYQDGFMLLVMGYTGAKAMQIKIAYIIRFNEMAEALSHHPTPALVTASALPITPDQRDHLRDILEAKTDHLAGGEKDEAKRTAWRRFHRRFGLKRYDQLPRESFTEAVEFVLTMDFTPQTALPPPPLALPPTPTEPDELECHFTAIKGHVRSIAEHEREVFRIVKDGMRPALLSINTPRRAIAIQAHTAMEKLFYSLDYGLEAAEATVRSALIASRV